jgi:hypothetical protein
MLDQIKHLVALITSDVDLGECAAFYPQLSKDTPDGWYKEIGFELSGPGRRAVLLFAAKVNQKSVATVCAYLNDCLGRLTFESV